MPCTRTQSYSQDAAVSDTESTRQLLSGTQYAVKVPGVGIVCTMATAADLPDTLDYPSPDDVRDGVDFDGGSQTGDLVLPAESDVTSGVHYGANGTEYEGSATGGSGGNSCF